LLASADILDIEDFEAYHILKEEMQAFETGSEQLRAELEKTWAERDRHAREEMEKEYSPKDDESFWQDDSQEEPDIFKELRNECVNEVQKMSDQELEKALKGHENFFTLLNLLENWFTKDGVEVFKRAWRLAPKALRTQFSEFVRQIEGVSVEDLLKEEEKEKPAFEPDLHFKGDFLNKEFPKDDPGENDEVNLKVIYRKLVRKLHPDQMGHIYKNTIQPEWIQTFWHRAQQAYQKKDFLLLEKLYVMTLLRLKELSALTIDEIKKSGRWLSEDLEDLELESKNLKRSWAWGFAKRKNFQPLIKKIEKNFDRQKSSIKEEIDGLEEYHEFLRRMPRRARKRKSSSAGPAFRKRRSHPDQTSFF
jgi:hypothetical protein